MVTAEGSRYQADAHQTLQELLTCQRPCPWPLTPQPLGRGLRISRFFIFFLVFMHLDCGVFSFSLQTLRGGM